MSNKVKSGLFFGLGMTFIFLFQTIITWVTGEEESTREIVKSVIAAMIAGLVSGLLFGWLTERFFVSSIFTKSMDFKFDSGETTIFQAPANHFRGAEGVGGSLCLTDKRLLFKSHNLNIQNHELSIPLSEINHVERYKTLGLINNGLAVHLNGDLKEKFVVDKASQWIENFERKKNGLQQGYLQ